MFKSNIKKIIDHWVADKYGSPRGFMLTYRHRLLYLFGLYNKYRDINWESVNRVVFVCKGNICRSAFAEAIARSLNVESISCGIDTQNGKPANIDAIRIAKTIGVDLIQHKTTTIDSIERKDNDLFIVMEPFQADYITRILGVDCQSTLLGLWGMPVTPYIHDPYNSSDEYFTYCFNYIEKSVQNIAKNFSG